MDREEGGQQGTPQMFCKLFHASLALLRLDMEFLHFNILTRYWGEESERGIEARHAFNLRSG